MEIQKFIEEIQELLRAKDLLEKIYLEYEPYQHGKITDKTWQEVKDYFGFDDNE